MTKSTPSRQHFVRSTRALRNAGLVGALAASTTVGLLQPLLATLGAQAPARSTPSTSSQQAQPKGPGDHRFRFLGMGAAIGGLLALGYYQLSDGGERSGRCMPLNCALPYLTISGGLSGLFIARERAAQRRAESPRAGEALSFNLVEFPLPAPANSVGIRDSLIVVATDSGASVMAVAARPAALRRRGNGLSNPRSVAVSGSTDPRLLIGTGTALWETSLTAGLLTRVMDGAVDALDANGDVVVAGFGNKLRVRHMVAGALRIDSVMAPAPVTSTRWDATSGRWWVTTDTLLLELTVGDAVPTLVQRASFTGQARAVAASANWVAVALGSDGLAIWPRTALGGSGVVSPIVLRGEPRFAFDLAFLGDALFVAGGVDGVTRVELTSGARILGSSRQAGYATSIVSDKGVLWVGDKSKNRLLRFVP